MRKPFVAGNWKMNTNSQSAIELVQGLIDAIADVPSEKVDIAICPPFVYLQSTANALSSSNISLGAQNVYFESNGAFTGEISCEMLKDVCCNYVIIGHSERRHVLGETDELINKKLKVAIQSGLLPIFCVGELLEEREAGKTQAVVEKQIREGLAGLTEDKMHAVTIAYEPVWAIGTGKTATPEQAQEVHAYIRQIIAEMFGDDLAQEIRIQYGGSVKPDNAAELLAKKDIDGALVGGASLKVADFAAIIKAAF